MRGQKLIKLPKKKNDTQEVRIVSLKMGSSNFDRKRKGKGKQRRVSSKEKKDDRASAEGKKEEEK